MNKCTLYAGLADFAEPTLLILGDAQSLSWLADRIESRKSLNFAEIPFIRLVNFNLMIEPTEGSGSFGRYHETFVWRVSTGESQRVSEQLRALAMSDVPAHAYLDPAENNASVEVVASKGEYIPDAVFTS